MKQEKFIITVVNSAYDNCIIDSREYTWEEFVQRFSHHVITEKKEITPMILPCSFKTIDEEYSPALMPKKYGRGVKYRKDGKPHIQRAKANVKHVFMLPLDIDPQNKDTDLSIEAAMDRFKDYQYFAYTSSGHRTERKFGKDAFRILLPFSRPITAKEYELRAQSFIDWQGEGVDKCSPDVSRGFFVPSYLAQHEKLPHKIWVNEGKLLDPGMFEEAKVWEPTTSPIVTTGVKGGGDITGEILWNTLDAVGLFKALGLYIGRDYGNRHFVHCPWESRHSCDSSGTVIYEGDIIKKAAFNCLHGGCKDKKMFDVTNKIKEELGLNYLKKFYEIMPDEKSIDSRINELKKQLEKKQ